MQDNQKSKWNCTAKSFWQKVGNKSIITDTEAKEYAYDATIRLLFLEAEHHYACQHMLYKKKDIWK